MVSLSTINTNCWDTVRNIIAADGTVDANSTYVGGAYPQKFIDRAGGLPFIVIHKPRITEERLTIKPKKRCRIIIDISIFADKSATLKLLSDAVRNSLESNQDTTIAAVMHDFKVTGDSEGFELRGNKRIHSNRMTIEYEFVGS